jgi:hypothetical protein
VKHSPSFPVEVCRAAPCAGLLVDGDLIIEHLMVLVTSDQFKARFHELWRGPLMAYTAATAAYARRISLAASREANQNVRCVRSDRHAAPFMFLLKKIGFAPAHNNWQFLRVGVEEPYAYV